MMGGDGSVYRLETMYLKRAAVVDAMQELPKAMNRKLLEPLNALEQLGITVLKQLQEYHGDLPVE